MALNWDITQCNLDKDWQKDHWTAIEAMIWFTMVIDVGEIKADNLEMVEFRLRCYSKASSSDVNDVIAILPKLVGLKTNVFTIKDNEFGKRILNILFGQVKTEMRWAKTDAQKGEFAN